MSNSHLLSLGCNRGHLRTHDGRSSLCEDQECRLPRSHTKSWLTWPFCLLRIVGPLFLLCVFGPFFLLHAVRPLFLHDGARPWCLLGAVWPFFLHRGAGPWCLLGVVWPFFLHGGARPWCLLHRAGPMCLLRVFTWRSRHCKILKHICYQKCYIV